MRTKSFDRAVERKFEIIGEAFNRLDKSDPTIAAQIPQHRQIISFRNVLIHGYDILDEAIVWQIIQADLPILKQTVEALLASSGPLAMTLNPTLARQQFPSLRREAVFFDGPAGSQVPRAVIDAISSYYVKHNANHGGLFATSRESDAVVDEARSASRLVGHTR